MIRMNRSVVYRPCKVRKTAKCVAKHRPQSVLGFIGLKYIDRPLPTALLLEEKKCWETRMQLAQAEMVRLCLVSIVFGGSSHPALDIRTNWRKTGVHSALTTMVR